MKQEKNEMTWDKKLKISTIGRDDFHEDEHHYPYEPTPYAVLERLVMSGYLTEQNMLVDYGCGKGRVGLFLHYRIGCYVCGIEYDERIFKDAVKNWQSYVKTCENIKFLCVNAESYPVCEEDSFYFFNPFSVQILKSVIGKIIDSYYANPRSMRFFFYYPNDEYISYLMTMEELQFVGEIDCQDLFEGKNTRERILIFETVW